MAAERNAAIDARAANAMNVVRSAPDKKDEKASAKAVK